MKFKTDLAAVSWSSQTYKASKGIITIPDDKMGPFQDLVDAGQLVPVDADEPAPKGDETPKPPTP